MADLKTGVIGLGRIGKIHLNTLLDIPDVEVTNLSLREGRPVKL